MTDTPVVFGVLDGATPAAEWLELVEDGHVLVLAVEGDVTELASDFAPAVKARGGRLVRLRETLVVAPPETDIDTDRL